MNTSMLWSDDELSLIGNASLMHAKFNAIDKVISSFEQINNELQLALPEVNLQNSLKIKCGGKITRGENYHYLPYVVLDHHSIFDKQDLINIRLLFLWGHEYSYSLIITGRFYQELKSSIIKNIHQLKEKNIFYCVNTTPWEYFFTKDNFTKLDKLDNEKLLQHLNEKNFIKLSCNLSFDQSANLKDFALASTSLFLSILK